MTLKSRRRRKTDKKQSDKSLLKLVLLGNSGCGKSTIFNYFANSDVLRSKEKKLVGSLLTPRLKPKSKSDPILGHKQEEKFQSEIQLKKIICSKLINGTVFLLNKCNQSVKNQECCNVVLQYSQNFASLLHPKFNLHPQIKTALKQSWKVEELIGQLEKNKYVPKFAQYDNLEYFLAALENDPQFCSSLWIPELQDIIRCTKPTTTKRSKSFALRKSVIHVSDLGGCDTEFHKWKEEFTNDLCYDEICIVYPIPIGDFDLACSDDEKISSLNKSLQLYRKINEFLRSSCRLPKTRIILFFNKTDIFLDKVEAESIEFIHSDVPVSFPQANWKSIAMQVCSLYIEASRFQVSTCVGSALDESTVEKLSLECLLSYNTYRK